MKYKVIVVFFLVLFFLMGKSDAFAQESPEEMVKKYTISFPVTELGNCTSFSACKAYCEKNPEECRKFGGDAPQEAMDQFCKNNPDKCAGGMRGPNPEEFCKQNPDKCSGGRTTPAMNPEEYCKQNPDRCRPPAEAKRRYEDSLRKEPQFQQPGQRPEMIQRESYQENRPPQFEQRSEQLPQKFEQTQQFEQRPSEGTRTAPPSEETPPTVQGVQVQKSILQIIRDFLSGK